MQVKITAFLGSLGAVCICMLKDSKINNLTEGKVKVAGEPGADFWQALVNVDVLFEVPASTADTQLCLLSLAFTCSFSSSLPSKAARGHPGILLTMPGVLGVLCFGSAAEKREQQCWARSPERKGGLERVLSPCYLCRSKPVLCCCFLPIWSWCPPCPRSRSSLRGARSRLQLIWGVAGVNERSA